MKKQGGITLIALVITIIILLILAGVTLSTVLGNNGIVKQAQKAVENHRDSVAREDVGMAWSGAATKYYEKSITNSNEKTDEEFFKEELENQEIPNGKIEKISSNGNGAFFVDYKSNDQNKDYRFLIENGEVSQLGIWKDNEDYSYTFSETGDIIKVGDIVKYELILNKTGNAVDPTKLQKLKDDLRSYSGDSSSTANSGITRDSLTWKVLDVKDGNIRLISSEPTTKKIKLSSHDGYNNAVYLLDKACDTLYSVSGVGKAQNLKIEDIEEYLSYNYRNYSNSNVDTGKYGGTKVYTSNLQYPNIYKNEIGCLAVSNSDNTGNTLELSKQSAPITGKSTATGRLKVLQTSWYKSMIVNDFKDVDSTGKSKYYNLFIKNTSNQNYETYWLSSRCAFCDRGNAAFLIRFIRTGAVDTCCLLGSGGYTYGNNYSFRPVICLESNVKLTGNSTDGWTIQN